MQQQIDSADRESLLPDFCRSEAVVTALIIMQLVALVLTLASRIGDPYMWQRLLLLSLYLHWIGLSSAAALCQLRRWIGRLPQRTTMAISYALLIGVTLVISETAWQVAHWVRLQEFLPDEAHVAFLVRNFCICVVVSALTLHYFWLQQQSRRQARTEAESRYLALQARIRPHFLFNSLNSIAALVATRPREAEMAVEDLAELFRAGLQAADRQVGLKQEIEVSRAYLRTESLRLGPRLQVRWEIAPDIDIAQLQVPSLCLQPLVENAVNHGIERLPEGGEILIDIRREGVRLKIEVANPVPALPTHSAGTGLALDNIRQRLRLMYGESASLTTEQPPRRFIVRLHLPITAGL